MFEFIYKIVALLLSAEAQSYQFVINFSMLFIIALSFYVILSIIKK